MKDAEVMAGMCCTGNEVYNGVMLEFFKFKC